MHATTGSLCGATARVSFNHKGKKVCAESQLGSLLSCLLFGILYGLETCLRT